VPRPQQQGQDGGRAGAQAVPGRDERYLSDNIVVHQYRTFFSIILVLVYRWCLIFGADIVGVGVKAGYLVQISLVLVLVLVL
jgi:hypothetical protein